MIFTENTRRDSSTESNEGPSPIPQQRLPGQRQYYPQHLHQQQSVAAVQAVLASRSSAHPLPPTAQHGR